MGVLKNSRHERMAQEMAKGKTAVDAYEIAGYKRDDGNAIRLSGRPDLLARRQELTGIAAAATGVTVERIINELAKIAFVELSRDGLVRANDKRAALVNLGKHLGMFQDNVNVSVADRIPKRAEIHFGGKPSLTNGRSASAAVGGVSKSRN